MRGVLFIMQYKPDFDRTKQYWRAFWEKDIIDRPAVCVTAPKKGAEPYSYWVSPSISYFACIRNQVLPLCQKVEQAVAATYYGGEALPQLDLTLGPDEYAGFLGGVIEGREDNFTTWSHGTVDGLKNYHAALDFSEDGYYSIFLRSLAQATEYAKDKFFLNMLDFHSHFDALAALRDPQELCYDLIDCPEEVQRVLDEIALTYPVIFEDLYRVGDMKTRGCIGWPPTYCEGKCAVVCCDYSCLLSPEMGKQFFLPYVEQEAAYLDRSVYHLDGKDALCHLDNLLAIKDLDVFQWVPGDGQPRTLFWMELLQKIQKAGKSLWIYDWTPEEIKTHFKELDPCKVVFSTSAASEEEAEELLEYLKHHM